MPVRPGDLPPDPVIEAYKKDVDVRSRDGRLQDVGVATKNTEQPTVVPIPTRQILEKLVQEGVIEWNGGKPKGLRGVVVRGEPVSETIVRHRNGP